MLFLLENSTCVHNSKVAIFAHEQLVKVVKTLHNLTSDQNVTKSISRRKSFSFEHSTASHVPSNEQKFTDAMKKLFLLWALELVHASREHINRNIVEKKNFIKGKKRSERFVMIIARKLIFEPSQIIYSELKKMKNFSSEIMMMTLWEHFLLMV